MIFSWKPVSKTGFKHFGCHRAPHYHIINITFMKWKIVLSIYCLLLLSLISCKDPGNEPDHTKVEFLPVTRQLSPVEIAAKNAITGIETKEIESGGDKVLSIEVEGMELMKYSKREYLSDELKLQEDDFKRYMDYLDRMKTVKALNNPQKLLESREKHDAVINYLKQSIKMASDAKNMYKATYYFRVSTQKTRYTQPKTMYLDSSMNKIKADYGFLQR